MDCSKFEKYIILRKEGLTDKELNQLEQHLLVCGQCRNFSQKFAQSQSMINNLRKNEPVLSNPELLTNQIMQDINALKSKKNISRHWYDWLIDWFFVPYIRPVFASIAILMIGLFMYTESTDQMEISNLENQLKKYSMEQYVTLQENRQNYMNFNSLKKYKGLRSYINSKYKEDLWSYNKLNSSEMDSMKTKITNSK